MILATIVVVAFYCGRIDKTKITNNDSHKQDEREIE